MAGSDGRNRLSGSTEHAHSRISVAGLGDARSEAIGRFDCKRMPSAHVPHGRAQKPRTSRGAWVPARCRYRTLRLGTTTMMNAAFMPEALNASLTACEIERW